MLKAKSNTTTNPAGKREGSSGECQPSSRKSQDFEHANPSEARFSAEPVLGQCMGYYDEISEGYEELHGEEQMKKVRLVMEKLPVKKSDLLLDVGSGTGITTMHWDCKKVGIDPAFRLLKKAKGGYFINAEAEHLPFADRSFDVVVSITAIQNFRSIRKGLEEIRRVGKGKFALSFLKKSPKRKMIEGMIREMFDVREEIEEDKDVIFLIG